MPSTGPSPLLRIKAIIEDDFPKIIRSFDPQGVEEVVAEYGHYPDVLEALAGVWGLLRTICETNYPLHPAIAGLLDTIAKHQRAVGTTSAEVPGLIFKVHADRFDTMQDPNQAMWDHRANPNTAAQPRPGGSGS